MSDLYAVEDEFSGLLQEAARGMKATGLDPEGVDLPSGGQNASFPTLSERADLVRRNRPRGIYVPTCEAQVLLHHGWQLLDDCPAPIGVKTSRDEVLLAPPDAIMEAM